VREGRERVAWEAHEVELVAEWLLQSHSHVDYSRVEISRFDPRCLLSDRLSHHWQYPESWERKRTSRSVLERRTRESAGEAHELGGARESVLEKRTREWALERTRQRSEPRTTRASEPANRREAREARGTSSKAVVLWDDAQREVATPFLFSFIGFV